MFSAVEISFLLPEIDHNGRPPGMALRDMRSDHVCNRAAAGEPKNEDRKS
jgi:hypothetical protein